MMRALTGEACPAGCAVAVYEGEPRLRSSAAYTAVYGLTTGAQRHKGKLWLLLLEQPVEGQPPGGPGGRSAARGRSLVVGGVDPPGGRTKKLYPVNFVHGGVWKQEERRAEQEAPVELDLSVLLSGVEAMQGLLDAGPAKQQKVELVPYEPNRPASVFHELPKYLKGKATTPEPSNYFEAYEMSHRPIDANNSGHALLSRLGWNPGKGLGKLRQGAQDPVPLVVRADRVGIDKREG
jgi:hypothetical protein